MHARTATGTKESFEFHKRTDEPARQQTTLPSISHLINGRRLGLTTAEELDEELESSEEDKAPRNRNRKGLGLDRAEESKRRHCRGRITDRAPKLEEKLKQQDAQFEKENHASKEELRQLQLSLESEKSKCTLLEEMLDKERADRLRVEKEVEVLRTTSEWSISRAGTEAST